MSSSRKRSGSASPAGKKAALTSAGRKSKSPKRPRVLNGVESREGSPSRSPKLRKRDRGVDNAAGVKEAKLNRLFVFVLPIVCFFAVQSLFRRAPVIQSSECDEVGGLLWFVRGATSDPKGIALVLSQCATRYEALHPEWTLVLYMSLYLVLQAFAIPGPLILSLVAGVLWPMWKAQIIIATCATCGASLCYVISRSLGLGNAVVSLHPARAEQFRARVREAEESGNLFFFMLFLRVSPLLPNWFVNLVSPGAGVPLRTFALATALGLVPANILHYQSGKQLNELVVHAKEGSNMRNMGILLALQFVALLPTVFKAQFKERLNLG